MNRTLILHETITYGDVDRYEQQLLPRAFKLLQDAAILHANQFGTGTNVVTERAESWVLNRMAVAIERYPKPGEVLRVETWSSGINGFKGYRDFRVHDAEGRSVMTASSLWLYISLKTKSIVRVPREVAAAFPVGCDPVWCPDLESFPFAAPAESATTIPVTLRYSDFDVNEHVNNAAYLDLIQTAVVRAGATAHPRQVRLKYAKAIPLGAESVAIRVERLGDTARFSVEAPGVVYALGETVA